MDQRDRQELFLDEGPTFEQQWQALSLNNQGWFARCAQARAKEVVSEKGIMWTSGHLAISSVNPLQIDDQLDCALEWYRAQRPMGGRSAGISLRFLQATLPRACSLVGLNQTGNRTGCGATFVISQASMSILPPLTFRLSRTNQPAR
ncbi:hypothetical protein [Ktedonobacter robiniae]|uniref:Uncharacterized protein n=1 Tax=Ktedonobacter robiniae TaxID=2778365 RepID=A0ABQ3UGA4_9CHLR|nr:hypothetical protein [Ktedonobacter robiniae]GHO51748.1 hypothetical protein KSB_02230 [Ktedonobacter robiniae]